MLSSVRNRLFVVVAGMALLATLAIGAAYVGTETEWQDVQGDRVRAGELADLTTLLSQAIHRQEEAIGDYLLARDPASAIDYQSALEAELRDGERIRYVAAAFPDDFPNVVAAEEALAAATSSWRRDFAEPVISAVQRGSSAEIAALAKRAVNDQQGADGLIDQLSARLNEADAIIAGLDSSVTGTRLLASLVAIGMTLLVAATSLILLRRWVTRPLARLLGTATSVEGGQVVAFQAERDDEIGRLGEALERMRLALQGDAERSSVLNRFTEVTTFAVDDAAVAASNLEALKLLVNPDAAVTHVLNRSKDRAIPEATIGTAIAEVLPLNMLSRCPGVVRGSIYVSPDAAAPLSVHCPIYPIERGTLACVPLAHGEVVGAVHLAWDRPNAFPLELRASVARIAEHAALAIANRRLLAALQGMASTDARTGLANTRSFDQAFEDSLAARGEGESVAVLMIDIDHFKDFNDRYGHPAGDEALRAFADILRSCLRDGDLAGRYGGEEFAVLLPKVDESAALVVAERIRGRTETTLISLAPGITDRLTVSVGVACAPAQGRDRLPLMRLADEALYRAKDRGRNRVEYIGAVEPASRSRRPKPATAAAGAEGRRRRASRRPRAKAS